MSRAAASSATSARSRWTLCLLAALTVLLLSPALAHAESLIEYRSLLAELLRQAEAAEQVSPPLPSLIQHPPTRAALGRLERVESVEIGGAGPRAVEHDDIAAGLRGSREQGANAIAVLRQGVATLDASATETLADPHASLEAVFSRPELANGANPVAAFLEDLRDRIFRWLDELMARLKLPFASNVALEQEGNAISWAVAILVGLFALASLGFALLRLSGNMARYAKTSQPVPSDPIDGTSARRLAEQAMTMGDIRGAVRLLYRSVVLHLAERRLISPDRSLTNHEYLRSLGGAPELATLVAESVEVFERSQYGHCECTPAELDRFRLLVDRIVETAG